MRLYNANCCRSATASSARWWRGITNAETYAKIAGRYVLIPQGAKLIGLYDSQISFGQDRVLLVWTRLIMPNGRSIILERQPGADTQGFAGLEDEVDEHWAAIGDLIAPRDDGPSGKKSHPPAKWIASCCSRP